MALSEEAKTHIQTAYSDWLSSNEYKPRRAQRTMLAIIAKALGIVENDAEGIRKEDFKEHVCLVEAGTGTGKTVAYSIASIILAKLLDKKLVISTATVTLQEQLVFRDLPNLQETSGIDFSFAIAKGRGRYLCLSKASMRLKDADRSGKDLPIFTDEERRVPDASIAQVKLLNKAFELGEWDGDRDSWEQNLGHEDWSLVAADRASCSGKKCPSYHQCALFKARDQIRKVDVVVANHDLVLADLATGGGNVLPEPEQTIYVFDEAHHLPSKSQNHLSRHMSLSAERRRVVTTQKTVARAIKILDQKQEIKRFSKTMAQIDEALDACLINLQPLLEMTFQNNPELANSSDELRFPGGVVPADLQAVFKEMSDCYVLKCNCLQKISDLTLASFTETQSQDQVARESLYASLGELSIMCESARSVCVDYARDDAPGVMPTVRWLKLQASEGIDGISMYAAPLSTASTLTDLIWNRCYASILTSATLTALGRFEHFIEQIGIGHLDQAYKILGELNFADSVFHVPQMTSDPTRAEEHTQEIIEKLPQLVSKEHGSLVLFSSRRQLDAVFEGLDLSLQERALVQGDRSKQALIKKHKERVDEGIPSILLGLASFSEGLDLPGDYCKQVVIAKLPFAVPDSPIDEALGEWIEKNGGNSFWDIAVPDVSIKLLQACGRLLRSESDTGRVSLLDNRILRKSYGKQLLACLPPFQQSLGKP
ncbi:MAG: ATP-dependent DNA helicase DinG [Pseudomonadales bacterium]|nr:ATP-dependent DNA helicase DinG [Pseudomonadales bacterium]